MLKESSKNSLTMVSNLTDLIELQDIWFTIQSNLPIWERVKLSLVCKDLSKTLKIRRGDMEQVKNKYYVNLQLLNQYNEWRTLRCMNGKAVWAPRKVTQFIQVYNSYKRELSNPSPNPHPHPTSYNVRSVRFVSEFRATPHPNHSINM